MKQNKIYVMIHCFNQNVNKLKEQIVFATNAKCDGIVFTYINTIDKYMNYNEKEIEDFIDSIKSSNIKIGIVRYDDASINLDKFIDRYQLIIDFELFLSKDKKLFLFKKTKDKNEIPIIKGDGLTKFQYTLDKIFLEKKMLKSIVYLSNIKYFSLEKYLKNGDLIKKSLDKGVSIGKTLENEACDKDINNFDSYIDQTQDNTCGFIVDFKNDLSDFEKNIKRFSEKIHNYKENV